MKTIAVIFGGRSTEHDVSIVTAIASVIKPLEASRQYKVEPIYIAKDGSWFWDEKLKEITLYSSGEINEFMRKASKVHLLFDDGLTLVKSSPFAGRKQYKKIDIVFPAMHGTHGEDGELMGLLEMANVAYVGCGVAASAIAMDKVLAKQVTTSAGIPTTPWKWFTSNELERETDAVIESIQSLEYPLFVKPAHLGSSIGISKVEVKNQLTNALEVAAHYDDKIIVEQGVTNLIEVTLPIVGNEDIQVALLERPLLQASDFFDFEKKYMNGGKKGGIKKGGTQKYSELPADIPKELYEQAVEVAVNAYKSIGCSGIARVDLLIDSKANVVYFNEINPMPGGLYLHNWSKAGISAIDLVTKLITLAEQRWQMSQKQTAVFNTNYLKQF